MSPIWSPSLGITHQCQYENKASAETSPTSPTGKLWKSCFLKRILEKVKRFQPARCSGRWFLTLRAQWESVCVSCTSGHIVPGLRERDAWVEHAAGRIVDDHLQFLLFSHTVLSEIPHHCVLVSWQVKDARCLKALPVVHCARYIISCLVCKKCEKWFKSKSYFSMILHWMIFLTRPCLFIQASDWC